MRATTKLQILDQISAIATMERGKLSAYSFKERSGQTGPEIFPKVVDGGGSKGILRVNLFS